MKALVDILHSNNCSLVVSNRGELHLFYQRGIKDLYNIYTSDRDMLLGASIADKVIGRAAAAIMILGGVKRVYADTISDLALQLFSKSDIEVCYGQTVPHIINRTKTGLCPLESVTKDIESLDEIFTTIDNFINSMA